MVISVEDFMAHHGTKGMKWGSRKSQTKSSDRKPLSRNTKIAIGAGATIVAGVGAAFAFKYFNSSRGKTPIATITKAAKVVNMAKGGSDNFLSGRQAPHFTSEEFSIYAGKQRALQSMGKAMFWNPHDGTWSVKDFKL